MTFSLLKRAFDPLAPQFKALMQATVDTSQKAERAWR